jgi:acetyltransferase-like isoleucine patch superfamily enzyme
MKINIFRALKNIYKKYKTKNIIYKSEESFISIDPQAKIKNSKIIVTDNSRLEIQAGVIIDGEILVSNQSEVIIGHDSQIKKSSLVVSNSSKLNLLNDVIILGYDYPKTSIRIDNGLLNIYSNARIYGSEILVRFGGRMEIGKYSGIGNGSEIRCEKEVKIGEFCLISYGVSIFDTNTHSSNWSERRDMIIKGFPHGPQEFKPHNPKAIYIGDDVWIGKNVMITKGAVLGAKSIIGMGCVVGSIDIPSEARVVSQKPRIISNILN